MADFVENRQIISVKNIILHFAKKSKRIDIVSIKKDGVKKRRQCKPDC
ncbi:MAG: hypothetical protein RR540_04545 [Oscillospiraceae bacterium]